MENSVIEELEKIYEEERLARSPGIITETYSTDMEVLSVIKQIIERIKKVVSQ